MDEISLICVSRRILPSTCENFFRFFPTHNINGSTAIYGALDYDNYLYSIHGCIMYRHKNKDHYFVLRVSLYMPESELRIDEFFGFVYQAYNETGLYENSKEEDKRNYLINWFNLWLKKNN